jgi:hypothetical protein
VQLKGIPAETISMSRMTWAPTAIVVVLFSGLVSFAQPVIIGAGGASCGKWLEARDQKTQNRFTAAVIISWVQGHLEGFEGAIAMMRPPGKANPFNRPDGIAISYWLDNYCAAHPLENIRQAAIELIPETFKK